MKLILIACVEDTATDFVGIFRKFLGEKYIWDEKLGMFWIFALQMLFNMKIILICITAVSNLPSSRVGLI